MLGTGQLGAFELGTTSEESGPAGYGQAQAKINVFDYPRHAQAQAKILHFTDELGTVNTFGSNIIPAFGALSATPVQGQAQADIKQTYQSFGQTNVSIKVFGFNTFGAVHIFDISTH